MQGTLLVLWDIDHTLIDGGSVALSVYAQAFRTATGVPLKHPWRFDGRTELAAATDELRAHGLPVDRSLVDAFGQALVDELRARSGELAAGGRVLPGAADALAAVAEAPAAHQSVLTGNLYPAAVLKLSVFGLADHVDFRLGAYGGDAFERTDLAAHALRRAERHLGRPVPGGDAVIVWDTPRDIATARAVGARVVAVATGPCGVAELAAAGADVVLPDLADTAAVLRAVTGRAR